MKRGLVLAALLVAGAVQGCSFEADNRIAELDTRLKDLEGKVELIAQKQTADEAYYQDILVQKTAAVTVDESVARDSMTDTEIQTALANAGFYTGAIDGKIGPMTEQGIREFQKANGLQPDGIIGAKTRSALLKYLKTGAAVSPSNESTY